MRSDQNLCWRFSREYRHRLGRIVSLAFIVLLICNTNILAQQDDDPFRPLGEDAISLEGSRQLAEFEIDVYGPTPFPETVRQFIHDEVELFLSLQRDDGSYAFLQGRKTEAGGTVGFVTQASLNGYSLRNHMEVDPGGIETSIARALDYVLYMVRSGKIRTNVNDAAWRYTYVLRFLVQEYPHLESPRTRALIEDACVFILHELRDMQQGTRGEKSTPVHWEMWSPPGMTVQDDPISGLARVSACRPGSPAFDAGVRPGDVLKTANGIDISTLLRYTIEQMNWVGGDRLRLSVLHDGEAKAVTMELPHRYPGTLGMACLDDDEPGVVIAGFDRLSNLDQADVSVGDRITHLDRQGIDSVEELGQLELYSGQVVRLTIRPAEGQPRVVEWTCPPIQAATFGASLTRGLDQSTRDGIAIKELSADSCLRAAGLSPGDRLLRIDGTHIMNRRHYRQLEQALWAGKTTTVTYLQDGSEDLQSVEVVTGAQPHDTWLGQGYHGTTLSAGPGGEVVLETVETGSPAEAAGCQVGDVVEKINGVPVSEVRNARLLLDQLSGKRCMMTLSRDGRSVSVEWVTTRPTQSPWISNADWKGGGWVYYTHVRGGTTFLSSDLLCILLDANEVLPINIPDSMLSGPFELLSNIRGVQPNTDVESYRYDAGGSFWQARDIRADVGRINAAELACVRYCDAGLIHTRTQLRTQEHLIQVLSEWVKHRGILDLSTRDGHGKFSIAPWYWRYSYMTTLEAASYLQGNHELCDQVQHIALKAYFQTTVHGPHRDLDDEDGWYRAFYQHKKEVLDACLMLDGLAEIKHLYQDTPDVNHPSLAGALAQFNMAQYGQAWQQLDELVLPHDDAELARQTSLLQDAIHTRFRSRLDEIVSIHSTFPQDGLRHLEAMEQHFIGYPGMTEVTDLAESWASTPEE